MRRKATFFVAFVSFVLISSFAISRAPIAVNASEDVLVGSGIEIEKSVSIAKVEEKQTYNVDPEIGLNINQLQVISDVQEGNTGVIRAQQVHEQRVIAVRNFLSKWKGAPAVYYAEEFVSAAEEYGVDYRLVASISIVESGGCKHTFRPYNCWGWGRKSFSSYENGIYTVTAGIAQKYYARGAVSPYQIGPIYAPPSDTWAAKVAGLMAQMPNI